MLTEQSVLVELHVSQYAVFHIAAFKGSFTAFFAVIRSSLQLN